MATQAVSPVVNNTVTAVTATKPSLHGPYEDAIIAVCGVLTVAMESQPVEVKKALWDNFVTVQNGLLELAGKIDQLHLFTPAGPTA